MVQDASMWGIIVIIISGVQAQVADLARDKVIMSTGCTRRESTDTDTDYTINLF